MCSAFIFKPKSIKIKNNTTLNERTFILGKILDYVRWRGDLTLDREPFNSLDAGLFAAFAYLPFDSSVKGQDRKSTRLNSSHAT